MSSPIYSSPSKRQPPQGDPMIFGPIGRLAKESSKILRLTRLDKALTKETHERQDELKELTTIWNEAEKLLETSAEAAKAKALTELEKLGPRLSSFYISEIHSSTPISDTIWKCMKDPKSCMISPVKKSTRGNKGPTALVSYPTQQGMRAYVVKCSHLNEQVSNRVYQAFNGCFSQEDVSWGFAVPDSCRLDFSKNLHETAARNLVELNAELATKLKSNFTQLAKLICEDPSREPDTTHIMLASRVAGQNLIDFAFTKYNDLKEPQKMKFFERLGRLGGLDFVLGNLDRLLQIDNLNGAYQLEDSLEVNLGNVMVSQGDNDYHVHAIDNGIDQALIDNKEAKEKYIQFLANLLKEKNPTHLITQNIIKSFENSFRTQIDDLDLKSINGENGTKTTLVDIRKKLDPFLTDLKKIAPAALDKGLTRMFSWLKMPFPHLWEHAPEAIKLKKYLETVYPEYLQAIQERFNAFIGEQK